MRIDDQKAMSQRALFMWASDNQDADEALFSPAYVNHQESDVEGGVNTRSLASWRELVDGFHEGFSECGVEILTQIAEGSLVATRWRITATHSGDYLDIPPTRNEVAWTGVQIDRFENDKIVESWVDWDKYEFFKGIGLVK